MSIVEVLVAGLIMVIVVGSGFAAFGSWAGSFGRATETSRLASLTSSALEQAYADQSWRDDPRCASAQGCARPSEGIGQEQVSVRLWARAYPAPPAAPIGYDVQLRVTLGDRSQMIRGNVDDGESGSGTLQFTLCRVSQIDERADLGPCRRRVAIPMTPPLEIADRSWPGPVSNMGTNPIWLQWESAEAANLNRTNIVTIPVSFVVDIRSTARRGLNRAGVDPAWFASNFVPAGTYSVRLRPTSGIRGFEPWQSKSIPSVASPFEWFTVRVAQGSETIVSQYLQPERVSVTLPFRWTDSGVRWRPVHTPGFTGTSRYTLDPLPIGRADIAGAGARGVDFSRWAAPTNGDTQITFTDVAPGLYKARVLEWDRMDPTDISLGALALPAPSLGPNRLWDEGAAPPRTAESSRVPYIYVERDGSVTPVEQTVVSDGNCATGRNARVYDRVKRSPRRWLYDPEAGWVYWSGEMWENRIAPERLMVRIAVGGPTDVEPGTTAPLMANRRRTVFDLGPCGRPIATFYGGGQAGA